MNDRNDDADRDTSNDWWREILDQAVYAVHFGDKNDMRAIPTDDLVVAIEAANDGGATADVCEALSSELDRREIAELDAS